MDPVPDFLTETIKLRLDSAQNVGNLPQDELLNELVWTVVVRTVRDVARKPKDLT